MPGRSPRRVVIATHPPDSEIQRAVQLTSGQSERPVPILGSIECPTRPDIPEVLEGKRTVEELSPRSQHRPAVGVVPAPEIQPTELVPHPEVEILGSVVVLGGVPHSLGDTGAHVSRGELPGARSLRFFAGSTFTTGKTNERRTRLWSTNARFAWVMARSVRWTGRVEWMDWWVDGVTTNRAVGVDLAAQAMAGETTVNARLNTQFAVAPRRVNIGRFSIQLVRRIR